MKVINIGAIAEQFVAQEFLAYSPPKAKGELFYWQREVPSSNAEVDMLAVKEGMIVPIEVKSGVKGGMKSMQVFFDTHPNSKYGIKISERNFSTHANIKDVPFYGIKAWLD
jgi:predicted AAA+ superfamily ATPase